jgi:hypothetical protein
MILLDVGYSGVRAFAGAYGKEFPNRRFVCLEPGPYIQPDKR